MMTKDEAREAVRTLAKSYGFKVEDCRYSELGIEIRSENLNFFLTPKTELNLKERYIQTTIEAFASISRMGGKSTPEELMAIAREINKGAALVECINVLGVGYREYIDEM